MKTITKILATSLFTLTLGLISANTMAKTVPVKFKSGASGATYSGKIKGYNSDTYTFYAKRGQILKTEVTGNVDATLFANGLPTTLIEYASHEFPATGNYKIRVLQSPDLARQGKISNYTLQLTIR